MDVSFQSGCGSLVRAVGGKTHSRYYFSCFVHQKVEKEHPGFVFFLCAQTGLNEMAHTRARTALIPLVSRVTWPFRPTWLWPFRLIALFSFSRIFLPCSYCRRHGTALSLALLLGLRPSPSPFLFSFWDGQLSRKDLVGCCYKKQRLAVNLIPFDLYSRLDQYGLCISIRWEEWGCVCVCVCMCGLKDRKGKERDREQRGGGKSWWENVACRFSSADLTWPLSNARAHTHTVDVIHS